MLHGIVDTFRNNFDKLLDGFLGFCRDAFIVVFTLHYRRFMAHHDAQEKSRNSRLTAAETAIQEIKNHISPTDERPRGAAAGKANGMDSGDAVPSRGPRDRLRRPRSSDDE